MRGTTLRDVALRMDRFENFTLFFVGDSITQGIGSSSAEHTYVAEFAQNIAKRYPEHNIIRYDGQLFPIKAGEAELMPLKTYGDPIKIQSGTMGVKTVVRSGIGGNTVRRMLNRKEDFIGKNVGGRTADLLFINAGVNDALDTDKRKYVTYDVYGKNLIELLDQIEFHMPDTDIVLMTPTYNDYGHSHSSCLDSYSEVMKTVAQNRNVPIIDLHSHWMQHFDIDGENYGQGNWLTGREGDTTHPSDIGHKAMADIIFNTIFEM